jgi:hypothetical protein
MDYSVQNSVVSLVHKLGALSPEERKERYTQLSLQEKNWLTSAVEHLYLENPPSSEPLSDEAIRRIYQKMGAGTSVKSQGGVKALLNTYLETTGVILQSEEKLSAIEKQLESSSSLDAEDKAALKRMRQDLQSFISYNRSILQGEEKQIISLNACENAVVSAYQMMLKKQRDYESLSSEYRTAVEALCSMYLDKGNIALRSKRKLDEIERQLTQEAALDEEDRSAIKRVRQDLQNLILEIAKDLQEKIEEVEFLQNLCEDREKEINAEAFLLKEDIALRKAKEQVFARIKKRVSQLLLPAATFQPVSLEREIESVKLAYFSKAILTSLEWFDVGRREGLLEKSSRFLFELSPEFLEQIKEQHFSSSLIQEGIETLAESIYREVQEQRIRDQERTAFYAVFDERTKERRIMHQSSYPPEQEHLILYPYSEEGLRLASMEVPFSEGVKGEERVDWIVPEGCDRGTKELIYFVGSQTPFSLFEKLIIPSKLRVKMLDDGLIVKQHREATRLLLQRGEDDRLSRAEAVFQVVLAEEQDTEGIFPKIVVELRLEFVPHTPDEKNGYMFSLSDVEWRIGTHLLS